LVKYAYNTLVNTGIDLQGEDLEVSIARLAEAGYDGVEFVGEPEKIDTRRVKALLCRHGLEASSICSIFVKDRDLVSSDVGIRRNGVKYVKETAKMASEIGAKIIVVAPSPVGKIYPEASPQQEWKWAVENIKESAEYARGLGVCVGIEPWNRYETYFLNKLDQALTLSAEIDMENVGVWGDTFHMNIEEQSIADAIEKAGKKLVHLHVADSNRAAPGTGHIDFKPIVKELKKIKYEHYLSFELLPAGADPFYVMKVKKCDEFFDKYTRDSIRYMKKLWAS